MLKVADEIRRVDIQLNKTSEDWKKMRNCLEIRRPQGVGVFTQFRIFTIFTSVDITVSMNTEKVLYLFYI